MRKRINLLVLGIASLIVVAFVVPLALNVQQQADQRGRLAAERTAQTLAALVVRTGIVDQSQLTSEGVAASLGGPVPEGSAILLPDGTLIGDTIPDPSLVAAVRSTQSALSTYTTDGFGLAIPVATAEGTTVAYSSVSAATLRSGVSRAWLLLGLLGLGLVLGAIFVADRLGRSVVGPSRRIASAADHLGDGDLDVRVDVEGPPELMAIAASFNVLAGRIRGLLESEREQLADLSHRLRTPLTALRLRSEQIEYRDERGAILSKIDSLSSAINDLILEARQLPEPGAARCDVVDVIRTRAAFWQVLATEQDRAMHLELAVGPIEIGSTAREAAATIDALLGNVFSHTPTGTDFGIQVTRDEDQVQVEVADSGPGFPRDFDPGARGTSGSESTGLGLDIVERFARQAGGEMRLLSSHVGGSRVVVTLPMAKTPDDDSKLSLGGWS